MPWNSASPSGTLSVKANRTPMNQNTTYIETTMGNSVVGTNTTSTRDHFWNVGSNEDGRHRFVQSPQFTVGGNPADPEIGDGMSGVRYLRRASTSDERIGGFYRSIHGIYQYIPSFQSGTVNLTLSGNSFVDLTIVPANVYGDIFMFNNSGGSLSAVTGFFRSDAALVQAWSIPNLIEGQALTNFAALIFGNGATASGFNIRVRKGNGANVVWNYRITYRAI